MSTKRYLRLLLIALGLAACTPQVAKISERSPDLFEKESDHLQGKSRGVDEAAAPEMYVKQKSTVIKDAALPNETGSLFNPDDERNYLFTPTGPLNVGRFLKVKVVANRQNDKKKDDGKKDAGKDDKTAKAGKDGKDDTEDELLKALPDLAPANKGEPALLKSFKMQIAHKYENGDVLAMMTRKTGDGDQAGEIAVQARIPYDRLASGDELTTDDLLDVKLRESKNGEIADRSSSGWEDEYSLRLSGFTEAKSKEAMELADQKKKLEETGEKLATRIKALDEQKKQFTKEKDDMAKKKADEDEKVQQLEDKVKEQQDQIQSLTPDDNGDGATPAKPGAPKKAAPAPKPAAAAAQPAQASQPPQDQGATNG